MSAGVYHVGAQAFCSHGGTATTTTTNNRVKVSGMYVATRSDDTLVAGCSFTIPSSKPQPCVKIEWQVAAKRVKVMGKAVLLQSSTGLCLSAEKIPQGAPTGITTQTRVKAT